MQAWNSVAGGELYTGLGQFLRPYRPIDAAVQRVAPALLVTDSPMLGRDHRATARVTGPLDRSVCGTEFLDQDTLAAALAIQRAHRHRGLPALGPTLP
ncbi:hypothetical protein IFM12275_14010 [Nocardia sputorum]|uniref:Uncharacterized protein n=1 Tax=Nocardia sputorum TaxID=2984338 RepID=A0ABM8CYE5_9NOCA|nr:hypothetical protein IFM12275_14010 [Nocardia sputorum]BDU00061.1 hypothetical protein IFM12276_30890 [Nocardia sputorum]